jgi:predicted RNase H-like HicB family nuclease
MARQLTTIIEKEGDGYIALCPEVDVASKGATIDEARNIKEAMELFIRDTLRGRDRRKTA